ncbi:secreted RxLR effector protein 78-like [Arachis hypogaea]|uniref:secreted RxLR effector protein 78-like n=1 Tax=Arachis hypogaea TaxID=3818 RepID=UPI003B225BC2
MIGRLRPLMEALVGVQNRKILDGTLIVCETNQEKQEVRGNRLIVKLEFRKAYDSVQWDFVEFVLKQMEFGDRWKRWINEMMRTAAMSIMVNGSPTKPFDMERELRQGDPLSPFLFILVAEVLNKMLQEAKETKLVKVKGLEVGTHRVLLSHLQFASYFILPNPKYSQTIEGYSMYLD